MSSIAKRLQSLQRTLCDDAMNSARIHGVESLSHIRDYAEQFQQTIPAESQLCEFSDLLAQISKSDIVLFGDFHTFEQNQRGLINLLKAFRSSYPDCRFVLGLEMFAESDQVFIDQYLDGHISEASFIDNIRYQDTWGFPWQNYRGVLHFAKSGNIPVFGVNTFANGKENRLRERDQSVARCLNSIRNQYPGAIVICLIGEYHLANNHLPRELQKQKLGQNVRITRIVSNLEKCFFSKEDNAIIEEQQCLRLSDDMFCILDSCPWIKWQSLVDWEDNKLHLFNHDQGAEIERDDEIDVDSRFLSLLNRVAELLDLNLSKNDLHNFYIYQSMENFEAHLSRLLHSDSRLAANYANTTWLALKLMIAKHIEGYPVCVGRNLFIKNAHVMALARACGYFLMARNYRLTLWLEEGVDGLCFRIVQNALGAVSLKILNPKAQLMNSAQLSGACSKAWGFYKNHSNSEDVAQQALALLSAYDWSVKFELSRAVGEMIGSQLYQCFTRGGIGGSFFRDKLSSNDVPVKQVFESLYGLCW